MRAILILALLGWSCSLTWAHNPSETFAEWKVESGKVVAELDVPWTFPEAVKAAYPDHGIGRAAFFRTVQTYVAQHFYVERKGEKVRPENIREVEMEETHGALLRMEFPVEGLVEMTLHNSIMLEYNPEQRNTNRIFTEEGQQLEVVTTKAQTSIFIPSNRSPNWPWVLVGSCALGLLVCSRWLFRK